VEAWIKTSQRVAEERGPSRRLPRRR
jgi:hypothetical protein